MIVQRRDDSLRLIRQHDHALASGDLATAWTGSGSRGSEIDGGFPTDTGPLAEAVILAVALHDLGWRVPDRVPRLNRRTGRPYDFVDFPPEFRFRAMSTGIDRVEELHPYSAVLVSLHHSTLGGQGRPAEFDEEEQLRRAELLEDLGDDAPSTKGIERDMAVLRLLDRISLLVCATAPGAQPDPRLEWLDAGPVEARWADSDTLTVDPYPFGPDAVLLEIPYRDLGAPAYDDRDILEQAWLDAPEEVWRVTVSPA